MVSIIRSAAMLPETRQLRRSAKTGAGSVASSESAATKSLAPVAAVNPVSPNLAATNQKVVPVASDSTLQAAAETRSKLAAATAAAAAQAKAETKPDTSKLGLFSAATQKMSEAAPAQTSAELNQLKTELAQTQQSKRKLEQELAEIRLRSDEELSSLRMQAERRGFAVGEEKGELAAKEALQNQIERLKNVAQQLLQSKNQLIDEAQDMMVEIVFTALCKIIGDNSSNRDILMQVVRDCVGETRSPNQVHIRLHPDDLALLQEGGEAGGAGSVLGLDPQLRFSADTSIVLGGCIVDSAQGSLDARLETQLTKLRDTLLAVRHERKQEREGL